MPYWLRKFIVAFVAVLTFGTIVPPLHTPTAKSDSNKSNFVSHGEIDTSAKTEITESVHYEAPQQEEEEGPKSWPEMAEMFTDSEELKQYFVSYTVEHAEKQAFRKFGSTIGSRVGDDYRNQILPKIGQVVDSLSEELDPESIKHLVVTEDPSSGYGERIFHIYNGQTGEDLVRFDVRREHPPKDGHWFNFHYHTNRDQFKSHHELGKIYWDKNMPPKWMA